MAYLPPPHTIKEYFTPIKLEPSLTSLQFSFDKYGFIYIVVELRLLSGLKRRWELMILGNFFHFSIMFFFHLKEQCHKNTQNSNTPRIL